MLHLTSHSRCLLIIFLSVLCFVATGCDNNSSEKPTATQKSPLDDIERMLDSGQSTQTSSTHSQKQADIFHVESFKQPPEVLGYWPPSLNQRFPDLVLFNSKGKRVRLSSFRNKVVLLEPIGMTCKACNAFSGAHYQGGFRGRRAQKGIKSIEEYLPAYGGGVRLDDSRLALVQVIFFNLAMKPPTPSDLRAWEKHFGFDQKSNVFVLGASRDMQKRARKTIPGFYLLDSNLVLRADSTGHHPRHNLFQQLLPTVKKLL